MNTCKEIFLEEVSSSDCEHIQTWLERKCAIEDLVIVLANNSELFKEDSFLYDRLIDDNKECIKTIEVFWNTYKEKHKNVLTPNAQLNLNYITKQLTMSEKNL